MTVVTLTPAVPAVNPDLGGDGVYRNDGYVSTVNEPHWGRTDAKSPEDFGAVMHYASSEIPLGAYALDWKIEVKASVADIVDMDTSKFSVLQLDRRLNPQDVTYHDARLYMFPDGAVFPATPIKLWDDAPASSNVDIDRLCSLRSGIGNVGQTWEPRAAGGTCQGIWLALGRSGTTSGLQARVRVWEAKGTSGAYEKDETKHVASSALYGGDTFNSGSTVVKLFAGGDFPFVTDTAKRYHTEVEFTGGSGDISVLIGTLDTYVSGDSPPVAANAGAVDNMTIYAAAGRKLQGFRARTNFLTGSRVHGAAAQGTPDTIDNFPSFVSGTVYTLGPTGASVDQELPNFLTNLGAALNARTSTDDHIGIRFDGVSVPTAAAERIFHGQSSATATRAALKGAILTVTYGADFEYLRRYEGTKAPNTLLRR